MSLIERFDLDRFTWRVPLMWQMFQARILLWQKARKISALRAKLQGNLRAVDETWDRWLFIRSKREKERIRKSLGRIERWSNDQVVFLDESLDFIQKKQRLFSSMSRWILQGKIDDRDGNPGAFLERMGASSAAKTFRENSQDNKPGL